MEELTNQEERSLLSGEVPLYSGPLKTKSQCELLALHGKAWEALGKLQTLQRCGPLARSVSRIETELGRRR